LTAGCLALVVTFKSSARLASAYGLAVACTMLCTTIAYFVVATNVFGWKKRFVLPVITIFALVDAVFVFSGLPKFLDGAWVPLAISAVVAIMSFTWLRGRRALARALIEDQLPLPDYLAAHQRPERGEAVAVMLTGDPRGVPFVRNHAWVTSFLCDKTVVLLHLDPADRPYVEDARRVRIEKIEPTVYVIRASFGYMETPSLKRISAACEQLDFPLEDEETTYFYSSPAIAARSKGGMRKFQRALFMWLSRISRSLVEDMDIPPDQRAGIGVEVAL
jgi:KUP system potassium uptake protein